VTLEELKELRFDLQKEIDLLLDRANKLTEHKNSYTFEINRLKRLESETKNKT
jgi:hypothetical protein